MVDKVPPFHADLPVLTPHRQLMVGVIVQAVADIRRWRNRRSRAVEQPDVLLPQLWERAVHAYHWLNGMPTPPSHISFAECCNALNWSEIETHRARILEQFAPDELAELTGPEAVNWLLDLYCHEQ